MVCAPVLSIIPSLKLGDYLSIQAHTPCSISHLILPFLYGSQLLNERVFLLREGRLSFKRKFYFGSALWSRRANRKSLKLSLFEKWWKNIEVYPQGGEPTSQPHANTVNIFSIKRK